ncbi:restriction endonuclease subunit S [Gardnerella vaginalis]|uniref:restriction endonuclease subunit S n=1 Tax=Gardnerella vaginalis TaxID=2702 RepID=UPI001FF3CD93|nr:restriction endonuclease subunit S [Gardnerella vaginalis]
MNSKLEELIAELCPNGVEYKKIGDIATIARGASPRPIMKFITNSSQGVNWIKIGDVNPGDKYITHTSEKITLDGAEKSRLVKKGDFILSNSMSFGRPYILKIDGCIHDGWLAISDFSATYMSDFLYYVLSSDNCQNDMKKKASFGGAVKNLNADIVRELILPVPPLEVQAEIVRILDTFTDLTAELTAELTARKKQYEYYRDTLLDVRDDGNSSVISLDDVIISLNTGLNPRQFFKLNTPDAKNYYITIREMRDGNIITTENTNLINDDAMKLCNNRSNLEKDDILFSGTGTIGETVLIKETPSSWNIKEGVYAIKPNSKVINPKYLRYFLTSSQAKSEYMKKIVGGTVKSIPMKELRKIKLILPNMEKQIFIAEILDRFDALCNDLTQGLPAEIEARRKQYEYYRNQLLTFKRA